MIYDEPPSHDYEITPLMGWVKVTKEDRPTFAGSDAELCQKWVRKDVPDIAGIWVRLPVIDLSRTMNQ